MNRLQQKCFVAAAAFHTLLVLLLFLGSGFRPASHDETGARPQITVLNLTSGDMPAMERAQSSPEPAGQPNAHPPLPPTERPALNVPATKEPTLAVTSKRALPQVTTNVIYRNALNSSSLSKSRVPLNTPERDSRAEATGKMIAEIAGSLSPAARVNIDPSFGNNQGKLSYEQIVKDAYTRNWLPPDVDSSAADGVSQVVVTIAKDGRILSARITRNSGGPTLDKSVQRTLDSVTRLEPFEPGATEAQRTYTISFNLKIRHLD